MDRWPVILVPMLAALAVGVLAACGGVDAAASGDARGSRDARAGGADGGPPPATGDVSCEEAGFPACVADFFEALEDCQRSADRGACTLHRRSAAEVTFCFDNGSWVDATAASANDVTMELRGPGGPRCATVHAVNDGTTITFTFTRGEEELVLSGPVGGDGGTVTCPDGESRTYSEAESRALAACTAPGTPVDPTSCTAGTCLTIRR